MANSDTTDAGRLQSEIDHLKELLLAKDQIIEAQAQALRFLEHKAPSPPDPAAAIHVTYDKVAESQLRLEQHEEEKKVNFWTWFFTW